MEASELGRWTRFAAKGGIGKCTAIQDCVAESGEDLMFLTGDEIVVLMQLQEHNDIYLGYCEGVVGRFEGTHVKFHSKLKKPIVAKRASNLAPSPSSSARISPIPSPRQVSSRLSTYESPRFQYSAPTDSDYHESHSKSTLDDELLVPPLASHSSASSAHEGESVPTTPADLDYRHETKHDQSFTLNDESFLYPSHDIPEVSALSSEPSTRISVATYDGMEGIGLSLLQNFVAGGSDNSSEGSDSGRSDTRTPEPRPPDSPESTVDAHGLNYDNEDQEDEVVVAPSAPPITVLDRSDAESQLSSHPSEYSEYNSEEWEGASDIYDNYRYSRLSIGSKMSRYSKSSGPTPPIPLDLKRSSIDSVTSLSMSRRPAPLDLRGPSPLLHTRFGSPLTSPTTTGVVSATSNNTSDGATVRDLLDQSPAVPVQNQTHITPAREAEIHEAEVEEEVGEEPQPESLIVEKKRLESTDSMFVIMNQAPPPPYTPPSSSSQESNHQPPDALQAARPRPHQSNPGLDFGPARTSMFLPHPGAPKAPGAAPGPLYGRAQHQHPQQYPSQQQFEPTVHHGPPPLQQLMHMAGSIRHYPNGALRQMTLYGMCEVDLLGSIGPVPITFSLEPPMAIPANRVKASQHSSVSPSGSANSSLLDGTSMKVASLPPAAAAADSGNGRPIPRSNFYPQAVGVRPRSQSFSGFDSTSPSVESIPSKHTETVPVPAGMSRIRSASAEDLPPPTLSQLPSSRSSLNRAHFSPLSLPQNSIRSSPPSPLARSYSPHPPGGAQTYTPSPLATLGSGLNPATSSLSLRAPSPSSPLATSSSPTTISPAFRPPRSDSILASEDHVKPLSPLSPRAVGLTLSSLDEPRGATPVSSSSERSLPRTRHFSAATVTESPSAPNGFDPRSSIDTDTSRSSIDARSASVVSPALTTASHATSKMSIRSKLSISANRSRSGHDDISVSSPMSDTFSPQEQYITTETVQVGDMGFELITPSTPGGMLSPQSTVDSFGHTDSPTKPDGGFLRADSPAVSMASSGLRSPAKDDSDISLPFYGTPPVPSPLSSSSASTVSKSVEAHRQRELKWVSLMSTVSALQAKKSKKVKKLLLDGVPASVRYQVWAHLADCQGKRMNGLYPQLVKRGRVSASETIEKDVKECFRDEELRLLQSGGSSDGGVVAVLQAYLNMVPDIRYHRGLTCVVGRLLAQAPEEDAFWIFISMMDAYLRPYFSPNPAQMEVDASLFAKAVESNDSELSKKVFVDMGIPPAQICRFWFMTLFFDALPVDYHLRVWDVFLFEGIPFLFRTGLALFFCCRRAILESKSPDRILTIITRIPSLCLPSSPDALIEQAMNVKLKDDDLRKHRSKMEAQFKRQTTQNRVGIGKAAGVASGVAAVISLPRS